jgi:ABC-2 type transport system permease protein
MLKLLTDTTLMFRRSLSNTLRSPVWALFGLFQPVLYLLLFAPLLEGMMGPSALATFTPGLLVMMAIYSAAASGYELIAELRGGVIERFRVTPVSRLALLLGPVLRDVLVLALQCLVLVGIAAWMGVRVSPVAAGLSILLAALLGAAMSALSYALALSIRDEGGLASVTNTFILPVLLLSGILLPLTYAPAIIKTIAAANPISHIVDAARALFSNQPADPAVLIGFAVAFALVVLTSWWATRLYRSAVA